MRILGLFVVGAIVCLGSMAQSLQPIGEWREHLPWRRVNQIQFLNQDIICATPYAVFKYNREKEEFVRKTKMNGLSDVGISAIAMDSISGSILIAYTSKLIDIWKGDKIIQVPDLKITGVQGDFTVNDITVINGIGYISTNSGILLLDIKKHEFKDRWFPGEKDDDLSVKSACKKGDYFIVATKRSIKKINLSKDGADYRNWETVQTEPLFSDTAADKVLSNGTELFVLADNAIFMESNGQWKKLYQSATLISGLDIDTRGILISESGDLSKIILMDTAGNTIKIFQSKYLNHPSQAKILEEECWASDNEMGLIHMYDGGTESIFPSSPPGLTSGDIRYLNGAMWFASGNVKLYGQNERWQPNNERLGIYRFDEQWYTYNSYQYPNLDTVTDIVSLAVQQATGKVYAASFGGGLIEINKDNAIKIFKYNSGLASAQDQSDEFYISGLVNDAASNLWISNYGSIHQLHLLKPNGEWYSFRIPFQIANNAVADILIDDYDQKWIISPSGNGLIVWNTGKSIESEDDDQWKLLTKGIGLGNLPSNNILSIAKDKNGLIWVGTDNGMGIYSCRDNVFSRSCDAIIPVVEMNQLSGYLFQDQKVKSIVVDGANRKWVGTTNGLWLISEDGEKVLYQFNTDNSHLLGNDIISMALNPVTGELFISTDKGICSFRSNATDTNEEKTKVLVFPNPVPPGYTGVIAIRGLPQNSWVKITELNGRLVFQGKSLGGQMIWNGRDLQGKQVSSGVYLVFSNDDLNQEKIISKIVLTR